LNNKNVPDMRVLTIGQREDLIKNGLGDREAAVRNAASGMIGGWIGEEVKDEPSGGAVAQLVDVSNDPVIVR
jgi:hypothetical protein